MERKIVDTINNPLLYITQPIYPPAKPKMQQTYVRRTSTHNYEKAQVQEKIEEKQIPVDAIAADITVTPLKKNPIEEKTGPKKSQIEENKKPIETQLKVETEQIAKVLEPKQDPVKSNVEPRKDLLKELLKEKLPGLEDIVEGKPVHFQHQKYKVVEQPKPAVAEVPEVTKVIEVQEALVVAPEKEDDVFVGEILEVEDKESTEKIEAAKEKRRMITTFGIRSSIEKGRKALAPPKKQQLPTPITINDIKNRILKEQNVQEEIHQLPQNQQEEVQAQVQQEPKKPRQKTFKEMSIEEKVEYLVNLPIAVPKVKCEIRTKETTIQGIIAGYKNGIVQIVQRKKPFRVDLNIEEILGINRKSF